MDQRTSPNSLNDVDDAKVENYKEPYRDDNITPPVPFQKGNQNPNDKVSNAMSPTTGSVTWGEVHSVASLCTADP